MGRYLMTHSLLASWLYTMKENPYEDMTTERDPMGEFMQTLRREPTPTTEAMQNGIKFEDMVTDIINGRADPNDPWYAAAEKVARRCTGGVLQYKVKKTIEVGGVSLLLYGRLDCPATPSELSVAIHSPPPLPQHRNPKSELDLPPLLPLRSVLNRKGIQRKRVSLRRWSTALAEGTVRGWRRGGWTYNDRVKLLFGRLPWC